eukprot:422675-Prymnesium_polylepis.1
MQSDEFLYSLCPSLKEDIHSHLYAHMLRSVALFEACEEQVLAALAAALRPQFFLEKDVLCREGSTGGAATPAHTRRPPHCCGC